MDLLGVKVKAAGKKQSRRSKKGIKIVYISSPMKVETCASKFRALVQELTGKDSDTARFMDINHDQNVSVDVLDHHRRRAAEEEEEEQELAAAPSSTSTNSNYSYESSSPAGSGSGSGSDSIFESFDKYMDGSFMSMFQQNFLYDSSDQLDFFQLEN